MSNHFYKDNPNHSQSTRFWLTLGKFGLVGVSVVVTSYICAMVWHSITELLK